MVKLEKAFHSINENSIKWAARTEKRKATIALKKALMEKSKSESMVESSNFEEVQEKPQPDASVQVLLSLFDPGSNSE